MVEDDNQSLLRREAEALGLISFRKVKVHRKDVTAGRNDITTLRDMCSFEL
jgi:hypothetical protein